MREIKFSRNITKPQKESQKCTNYLIEQVLFFVKVPVIVSFPTYNFHIIRQSQIVGRLSAIISVLLPNHIGPAFCDWRQTYVEE
jgi:hypothetical protein